MISTIKTSFVSTIHLQSMLQWHVSHEYISESSTITCTPELSKIIPSGAYVVPLTLYSESCGPCKTEWTTQIWTKRKILIVKQTQEKYIKPHMMLRFSWVSYNRENRSCFSNSCFTRVTLETDIILVVKVPVLSLHITVVQPKVSTDGKDLTIAFRRAIRLVPRAKHL